MDVFSLFLTTSSVIVALVAAYISRKKRLEMETELKEFLARKEKAKNKYKDKSEELHFH